ncbi:MAG: UDP-2,3-diacylglucosamine diphosphatase [Bacteroidales bacterium]|nr:UDP-2,3-diacylglucosamine diphosphatase [Bacteroidales bacterium]
MSAGPTVYFLSDLHLGAAYTDVRSREAAIVAFLRSIEGHATELYLLGDVLDYWYEYRTVVPRGYVRFFGQLARLADSGTRIVWFTGNHDIWLFDYLRDEIGIEVVDAPAAGVVRDIAGRRFLLSHGDTFGPVPRSYRMLRALFRNRLCQLLFAGVHPRWTVPLAHAWSSHNRTSRGEPTDDDGWKTAVGARLVAEGQRVAAERPDINYIVMGHFHLELNEPVGPHCHLVVLGEWLTTNTYATFDGTTLQLHRWE